MNTKNKIILLSILILIFIAITIFVVDKNIFVINLNTAIKNFIETHQYSSVVSAMFSITKIGDIYEAIIISVVFGFFLILKNKKYFYVFAITASLGALLPQIIKVMAQIQRPMNLFGENDYSFPSGHATIATVFLLSSIFLLAPLFKNNFSRKLFLLIAWIIFPLIAFSRIYLSVHWTTDVIAGIVLGAICFVFSTIVCCHKKENVL